MSAQSPDFETSKTTMAAEAEEGHTTDSTSNGEQFASDSLQEKQDGVAAEHAGDDPEYATGWRLAAIMCTIFLTTLLAALDIVSIWLSTLGNHFLTDSVRRVSSPRQSLASRTTSTNSMMSDGMEAPVSSSWVLPRQYGASCTNTYRPDGFILPLSYCS
jgi:hypothetical protein